MEPVPYMVERKRRETRDTYTLVMRPAGDAALERHRPGQFSMLYAFGVGEVPVSVSEGPGDRGVFVHTVRSVGAITRALCGVKQGDVVGVRGPFGSPWPVDETEGEDILIVAGGLGIAPLRPALHQILANRDRYGRVAVAYGARTPSEIVYGRELQRWRGRFDVDVRVTVDRADTGWKGDVGVVTRLLSRVNVDPVDTVALICGPEIMMRFATLELQKLGLAPERMYISMERNMKCAVGFCGHCQYGPYFLCKDGPVFRYDHVARLMQVREV